MDRTPPLAAGRDGGWQRGQNRASGVPVSNQPGMAAAQPYFDDLSEAETADMLGCSLGTVKSQAARGLARLRGPAGSPPARQSKAAPGGGGR